MIKRPKFSNNPFAKGPRNVIIIAMMFVGALIFLTSLTEYTRQIKTINYSTFLQAVEHDQVKNAHIAGQDVSGRFKDGSWYETVAPAQADFTTLLRAHEVDFGFETQSGQMGHWYFLFMMLVAGAFLGMWYFFKQKSGSNNGAGGIFSMGKSRAKMTKPSMIKEGFSSVAGAKEAKQELQDVVDYLKNPEKFRRLGAKVTRGILLVGEPGNGKTLLARAVAGEANCAFFSITGSDFIEVFVGVGAARVRDMFAQARRQGPSIIFIDEIDAIGRQRGSGIGGGHDEREQTLNQLLTEMDGFEEHGEPVIVMAATNMPEVLDKALMRPGRFDRVVTVPYPDQASRLEILKIHARDFKLNADVNLEKIAEETAGFSGADLANLMNKAALLATKKNKDALSQEDLEQAHKDLLSSDGSSSDRRGSAANATGQSTMFMPAQVKTKFSDVAGADEAKEELQDIVNFLKNPQQYQRLGAHIPRGVLLTGNPGNGKTLLARAIAGEANCPFFNVSGSAFIEQYVGTGAARVRELFAQARKHKPSIIFIDEIDAIGMRRSDSGDGGSSEYTQTINQLLAEMDGFNSSDSPIIVIGATNRPQVLDKALVRPGRFGMQIEVPYPTLKNREKILHVHMKNIKYDDSVNIERLAQGTTGFSGAQLAGMVNEAALLASKDAARTSVSMADFEEARDKMIMGKAMLSKVMSPEEIKLTAYHEAGHALMHLLQAENANPLYKVTIVPRGMSLGSTHGMPKGDVYTKSYDQMMADIKVSLGGRVAELLFFNKLTTGASSDFENATNLARQIVTMYGMYNPKAPVVYANRYGEAQYSQRTAEKIDAAIEEILEKAQVEVTEVLSAHKADLEKIARALLERETLDAHEMCEVLGYDPVTGKPSVPSASVAGQQPTELA